MFGCKVKQPAQEQMISYQANPNSVTAEGVGSDLSVSLLSAQGRITADGL